jgi:hypothetical protein
VAIPRDTRCYGIHRDERFCHRRRSCLYRPCRLSSPLATSFGAPSTSPLVEPGTWWVSRLTHHVPGLNPGRTLSASVACSAVTPASMASRDVPGLKQGEQRRRACLAPTAQHRPIAPARAGRVSTRSVPRGTCLHPSRTPRCEHLTLVIGTPAVARHSRQLEQCLGTFNNAGSFPRQGRGS